MKTKMHEFLNIIKTRHSNYTIVNQSTLEEQDLIHFIGECVKYNPSAFNIQSSRIVLLLGKQGKHLWEYVISQLTKPISESALVKLNSCLNAYATILFYDDTKVTIQEARQRNLREEGFASWALQANAMLQHSLWLGLSYLDYAVNIQHYNTLIEIEARNKYEIPDHWQLIAQMSFGKFTKDAQKHSYLPIAEQLFIKR